MSHEGFYINKAQEASQYKLERATLFQRPQEVPHLKSDLRYHRNSEKNIQYLKTYTDSIVNNIYTQSEESILENSRKKFLFSLPPLTYSNSDFKLCNPLNNLKRNRSQINFFTS